MRTSRLRSKFRTKSSFESSYQNSRSYALHFLLFLSSSQTDSGHTKNAFLQPLDTFVFIPIALHSHSLHVNSPSGPTFKSTRKLLTPRNVLIQSVKERRSRLKEDSRIIYRFTREKKRRGVKGKISPIRNRGVMSRGREVNEGT